MSQTFDENEIQKALEVLRTLQKNSPHFIDKGHPQFTLLAQVRAEANRLIESIKEKVREKKGFTQPEEKAQSAPEPIPVKTYLLRCYFCRKKSPSTHELYPRLCPTCGALNLEKRNQSANLSGYRAIVTGGRIRIGFETALKLLRAGAIVEVTTRFPCDAARRYTEQPDFDSWASRLRIHAIDLRDLRAVHRFAEKMTEKGPFEILVNNAAQTVRRPPIFYEHLVEQETKGVAFLSEKIASVISQENYHVGQRSLTNGNAWALQKESISSVGIPSALSQIPLLEGDENRDLHLFPLGEYNNDGEQIDRRENNSWMLRLGEIQTVELLETTCVNLLAPFILTNQLLPLMRLSPLTWKFIINVSAFEGVFQTSRKQPEHPHTNIAKAGLNMLTCTSAKQLIQERIVMNSVDPGWVSDQRPYPIAEAARTNMGAVPVLDAIDGAARICDPIFTGVDANSTPIHGVLLKNYLPSDW